jgi:hypothetical protein
LWKGLKYAKLSPDESKGKGKEAEEDGLLGVGVIVEALDAVFASDDAEDEESVILLGGRVRKTPEEAEWSREGWDLFYAFVRSLSFFLSAPPR